MATVYLILALVIAIIAVIFALQNTAIGVVIGFLFLAPSVVKSSFQVSGHRKRITLLEKELAEHKAKVQRLTDEKQKTAGGASEAATPRPK